MPDTASVPEWVNKTPHDHRYELMVLCDQEISPVQDVELTRAEFIWLKERLAEHRGYLPQPVRAEEI